MQVFPRLIVHQSWSWSQGLGLEDMADTPAKVLAQKWACTMENAASLTALSRPSSSRSVGRFEGDTMKPGVPGS